MKYQHKIFYTTHDDHTKRQDTVAAARHPSILIAGILRRSSTTIVNRPESYALYTCPSKGESDESHAHPVAIPPRAGRPSSRSSTYRIPTGHHPDSTSTLHACPDSAYRDQACSAHSEAARECVDSPPTHPPQPARTFRHPKPPEDPATPHTGD